MMFNLDNYSIISFDLFDTLIKRDVKKPTDVFRIVHNRMKKKYSLTNFYQDRIFAERDLYTKKEHEEITIDEIYNNFPSSYSKSLLEEYKKNEIETEYEVCNFNENIKTIYNSISSKQKIIIITDIYLPQELIERILKKCGIHYDALFVSSEIKLRKSTGNLFKYVLNELNISPCKIIHIGDNKSSDYKIPKSQGISAYKIKTVFNNSIYNSIDSSKKSFEYSLLSSFINNRLAKFDDRLTKIGYETLGPLLFGYSKWLSNNFENENYDKIFFLARDGQLMKKAFELLDTKKMFNSDYFYASRRALIVPNLKDCQCIKEMFTYFTFPKYITLNSVIKKFGINLTNDEIILKYGIDADKKTYFKEYTDLPLDYKKILDDLYFTIVENSKTESINELKYIKNKISDSDRKIAIVDIGWYGNMQTNLEQTLSNYGEFDIHGYYVGLVPKQSNKKKKIMNGYLFNTNDCNYENYIREKNFNSLFELLFSADHGTVIKYKNKEEAILAEFEYSNEQFEQIKKIQTGALKFVEDIASNSIMRNIDYSIDDISHNIYNLGNNPLYIDALTFGDFLFMDNNTSKLSNYHGQYFMNFKKLFNDFKTSQWKIAFLRLLFKIDLPYEKICRILRGSNIR